MGKRLEPIVTKMVHKWPRKSGSCSMSLVIQECTLKPFTKRYHFPSNRMAKIKNKKPKV